MPSNVPGSESNDSADSNSDYLVNPAPLVIQQRIQYSRAQLMSLRQRATNTIELKNAPVEILAANQKNKL